MHLQLEPFVIKDSANVAFEKKKHNRNDNATSAGPSPERFSSNMMLHFLDFALLLERDLSCHQDIQIMRCATRDCSAMQCYAVPKDLTNSRTWSVPSSSFSCAWLWTKPWWVNSQHGHFQPFHRNDGIFATCQV